MKAVVWRGKNEVHTETVPDPKILNPHDAIVRVTLTAICGSDLHLYDGRIPGMKRGDILGHEFMGEVVEIGREVERLKVGDRVVVPFPISCGSCYYCKNGMFSLCDNSNPNAWMTEKAYGYPLGGIFGYSHMFGGYAGGQAELVRVPYADVGPLRIPEGLSDEQVLFLSDIVPTAWQAVEYANVQPGDTVAIWGCGPVGLLAVKCAYLLGAERVVAIDRFPERIELARQECKALTIDYEQAPVMEVLYDITAGRGPDSCIDAVGMEAHGKGLLGFYDDIKTAFRLETDSPFALRQAIQACRKGGTVSIPGVYGGMVDKFPLGAVFGKGLTLRTGQTHAQKYMQPLLERIQKGELDATFLITHRMKLDDAAEAYALFQEKREGAIKIVLTP